MSKPKTKTDEPTARELAIYARSTLRIWVNKWFMDNSFDVNDYYDDDDDMLANAPQDLQDVLDALSKLIAVLSLSKDRGAVVGKNSTRSACRRRLAVVPQRTTGARGCR